MNQREQEICERLRQFREAIDWSQRDFAEQIGLTRDQLAHIEYKRTPMRYEVAWRIRRVFGLSVDWLWGGDMSPDDLYEDEKLPLPGSSGVAPNALLTSVFKQVYSLKDDVPSPRPREKRIREVKLSEDDIRHRGFLLLCLKLAVREWLARIPDGYTADFYNKLEGLAESYLKALPEVPTEIREARVDALRWDEMKDAISKNAIKDFRQSKKELTDAETKCIPSDMQKLQSHLDQLMEKAKPLIEGRDPQRLDLAIQKPLTKKTRLEKQLPSLLERLRKATAETGKKSELADFLKRVTKANVPLASVSRWLSGEREPGGEMTLLLLRWVELQERQGK